MESKCHGQFRKTAALLGDLSNPFVLQDGRSKGQLMFNLIPNECLLARSSGLPWPALLEAALLYDGMQRNRQNVHSEQL